MNEENNVTSHASPGVFAITIFLGSTVYLALLNYGWSSLLTYKAVMYMLLGAVAVVILIGVPFHLSSMWIGKAVFKPDSELAYDAKIRWLKFATTVLMVVQVITTFYANKLAYHWYFS